MCERSVAALACIINPVTASRPFDLQPAVEQTLFDRAQRFNIFIVLVHSSPLQGCELMGGYWRKIASQLLILQLRSAETHMVSPGEKS